MADDTPIGQAYAWPAQPILDPVEASEILAQRLQVAYDTLEAKRVKAVLSIVGNPERRAATIVAYQDSLAAFLAQSDSNVRSFLALHVRPRYAAGAQSAGAATPFTWTQQHVNALTSLATDTYEDFLARANQAGSVSDAMVAAIQFAAGEEIPKIAAGGTTAKQAGDALAKRLIDDYGIDTVRYANGTDVRVLFWARMAARTKSAVAYNTGSLNEYHVRGVTHVEVFDGPDCGWTFHEDPDKADGSIRLLAAAAEYVISHPNCRRAFGASLPEDL